MDEGGDHPQRSADGRHRTTATGTQICFAYNHSSNGCEARDGLMSVNSGAAQVNRMPSEPRVETTRERCERCERCRKGKHNGKK